MRIDPPNLFPNGIAVHPYTLTLQMLQRPPRLRLHRLPHCDWTEREWETFNAERDRQLLHGKERQP